MAIDVRAKVFCNLGPVISGNLSDEQLSVGQGLIRCRGQIILKGLFTPSVGSVVTLGYEQDGVVARIPRVMRVLGSFADPFRNTTTVSLGDKLVLLYDKNSAYKENAPKPPEQEFPDDAEPGDPVNIPQPFPDNQPVNTPEPLPIPPPLNRYVWNGVCWREEELPEEPDAEGSKKSELQKRFPNFLSFDFGSEFSSRTVLVSEEYGRVPLRDFLEVKPTISASFIAFKCLAGLGLSSRGLNLSNQYETAEFDLTEGYVSVLDKLLASESKVGYLDETETLVVSPVIAPTATGPVITEDDIIDFGQLNIGTPPSQRVIVLTTLDKNRDQKPIPPNVAPVANDYRLPTRYRNDQNFTVSGTQLAFKGFDPDYLAQRAVASSRSLSVASISSGTGCSVFATGIDNAFITVVPDGEFTGAGSFSFTLTDGQGTSNSATCYFELYAPDTTQDLDLDFNNPVRESLEWRIQQAEEEIAEAQTPPNDTQDTAQGAVTEEQKQQADKQREQNKKDWEFEESQGADKLVLIAYEAEDEAGNTSTAYFERFYRPYTNSFTQYDEYDRVAQRATRSDRALSEVCGSLAKSLLEFEGSFSDPIISNYTIERFGYYTSWDRDSEFSEEQTEYGKAYEEDKERERAAWEEANRKNKEAQKSLPVTCPLDFNPPENPADGEEYTYNSMRFVYEAAANGRGRWTQLEVEFIPRQSSFPSAIYTSDLQATVVRKTSVLYSWMVWQETNTYGTVAEVQGGINVPFDEDFYIYPNTRQIKTDSTYVEYDVDYAAGKTKTTTRRWTIAANTAQGQQLIAELGDYFKTLTDIEEKKALYIKILEIATTLVYQGAEVAIRTDREYGIQQRPSVYSREWTERFENEAADPSVFGDYEVVEVVKGARRSSNASAELDQFLPPDPNTQLTSEEGAAFPVDEASQVRFPELKITMPYTPAPSRDIDQDQQAQYEESKARQQALAYARASNALLRGNRFGASIQLSAKVMPRKVLDWLYVKIGGVGAAYRTNGTSWVFNEAGLICNTDALFWGGVGGTGSSWFPLAQGINSLPPLPAVTTATPAPSNSIPTPQGFNAADPGTIWSSLPYLQDAVYAQSITPETLVPAYQERVTLLGVTRLQLTAERVDYSLTVAPKEVVLQTSLPFEPKRLRLVKAEVAVTTLIGQAAALKLNKAIKADAGSLAATGFGAGSIRDYRIGTNFGTFVAAGQNANFVYQRTPFAVDAGSVELNGQDAEFRKGIILAADAGALIVSGQDAGSLRSYSFPADAGSFAVTGQAASLGFPPNVALLLHMDGANGGNTFTDSSGKNYTVTPSSGMTTSTTIVKFGSASAYASTTSHYLSMTGATAANIFGFGSADFTVEAWIYPTQSTTSASIYAWGITSSIVPSSFLEVNTTSGSLSFLYSTNGSSSTQLSGGAAGLLTNGWHHVAIAREGSTMRGFIDGVQVFSGAISGTIANQSARSGYIMTTNGGSNTFLGYLDEFRVVKGSAIYTGNFVPPTAAFPNP